MALNIIKLCVGAEEIAALARYQDRRDRCIVHTRSTPKRADEVLDGGSLFWVIKGLILVRQPIIGIETLGPKGQTRCEIELDRAIILTAPTPRRAFQGWRYLTPEDAPPDLEKTGDGAMPSDLAAQLRAIGAW